MTQRWYDLKIGKDDALALDALKPVVAEATRIGVVRELIRAKTSVPVEPIATLEAVLAAEGPVVIHGLPKTGKSETLKKLLADARVAGIPFVLFDFSPNPGEHATIEPTLTRGDAEDRKFLQHPASRVRLDDEPRHRRDDFADIIERLDESLNDARNREYLLAFEESEEFYDLPPFLKFLAKARKYYRQAILVSPQLAPFSEICRPMRTMSKS